MDNKDWEKAGVLSVGNCRRLKLKSDGDVAKTFDRAALIIENVEELTIDEFDDGKKGAGTYQNEKAFSSIYIRNSSLYQVPTSPIPIEEKAEFVLFNVTLDKSFNGVLELKVDNEINKHNPILRIEQCTFDLPASTLTSPKTYIKIVVRNEQKVFDSSDSREEGCEEDYKGEVYFKRNKVAFLPKDAFQVNGAAKVMFEMNIIEVMNERSVDLLQVKIAEFRANTFRVFEKNKGFSLSYKKGPAKRECDKPDLPFNRIKATFTENTMWNYDTQLVDLLIREYTEAEEKGIVDKILVNDNAITDFCDCEDIIDKPETDAEATEIVMDKLIKESQCWSQVTAAPGRRMDICKGKHPESLRDSLLSRLGLKNGAERAGRGMAAVVTAVAVVLLRFV